MAYAGDGFNLWVTRSTAPEQYTTIAPTRERQWKAAKCEEAAYLSRGFGSIDTPNELGVGFAASSAMIFLITGLLNYIKDFGRQSPLESRPTRKCILGHYHSARAG
jgi:hypothetical protein